MAEYIYNNVLIEQRRCDELRLGFFLEVLCDQEKVETIIKALAQSQIYGQNPRPENTKVFHESVTRLFRVPPIKQRFYKLQMHRGPEAQDTWWARSGLYHKAPACYDRTGNFSLDQ